MAAMEPSTSKNWQEYWPLIALIFISLLAASAITFGLPSATFHSWMHYFMGIFLCIFALLKIFNPAKFAEGFQMYDLLAQKSRSYALIYPFIELFLGLAFLAFIFPALIYLLTILVMGFGAIGVIKALQSGLKVNCACMGTILNVPLSTVTLTEDIAMVAMSLFMLISLTFNL